MAAFTRRTFLQGLLALALAPVREGTAQNGQKPVSAVRQDGTLLLNGSPFFPFGFTNVAYYPSLDTQRMAALQALADAGFNTMYQAIDLDDDDFLNMAKELGISILAEFNALWPPDVIDRYVNHPAILGWAIWDDVGSGPHTPEQVCEFGDLVRTHDPSRMTYMSGGWPKKIGQFSACADTAALQSYPIPVQAYATAPGYPTPESPLGAVHYAFSQARDNAGEGVVKPNLANLQAFAYQGLREPTPTEVRNMTYQALVNGVKGILYYTWRDGAWLITDHDELWQGIQSLVPEIKMLEPVLLNGTRKILPTGFSDVVAACWSLKSQLYIVVINTSEAQLYTVSLRVPPAARGPAIPLFPWRPASMSLERRWLRGPIGPAEVHVYRLGLSSIWEAQS